MTAVQMTCATPQTGPSAFAIESARLVLRALCPADADKVAGLANNRNIAEMTATIPHPYTAQDALDWIAGSGGAEGLTLAICRKSDGEFIGCCGYFMAGAGVPEIGYWIGEPYWNQGYATEAVRAMIDHLFTSTEHGTLTAGCRVTNAASRAVLDKCGFQWTGARLFRSRSLQAQVPADSFRLTKGTWTALRSWGRTSLPNRVVVMERRAR
jgi:RimJ/RimL family protein N-acetyltransferase